MRSKFIFILLGVLFYSCCGIDCEKQKYAEFLIDKIEQYRTINDSIPNNLRDMGIEVNESDKAYFHKISRDTYTIWYGTTLGDSNIYYSSTKSWAFD